MAERVDHGQITIKGKIDSVPYVSQTSTGKDILRVTVWAQDNNIYHTMTMQNIESLTGKLHEGDFVTVSGKHQTVTYNDDQREEIAFATFKRWEPAWANLSEIQNALGTICTKLLDKDLELADKLDAIIESDANKTLLMQESVIADSFQRCLLALQLLNHECRPVEQFTHYDDNIHTLTLVFYGQSNFREENDAIRTEES